MEPEKQAELAASHALYSCVSHQLYYNYSGGDYMFLYPFDEEGKLRILDSKNRSIVGRDSCKYVELKRYIFINCIYFYLSI